MAEMIRNNPNVARVETPQTWSQSIVLFLSSIVNSIKYFFKSINEGFVSGWRSGWRKGRGVVHGNDIGTPRSRSSTT